LDPDLSQVRHAAGLARHVADLTDDELDEEARKCESRTIADTITLIVPCDFDNDVYGAALDAEKAYRDAQDQKPARRYKSRRKA